MKIVNRIVFYGAILSIGIWLMSLNETIRNLYGASMIIMILRLTLPTLVLNYRMRKAERNIEFNYCPSNDRRWVRGLFYAIAAGLLLACFNDQLFIPLACAVIIILSLLYLPLILRGYMWEEETDEGMEVSVWHA
ncbi:hypothetical protein [Cohnella sp. AR92]|uniref:hypothetical protein n=1 Tax=Cohnella sp. AR92 TaxID=648716 RepID=UPI000F8D0E53|nr:hypothetical protein [Cohnella sp. AR92]RUS44922.1 hypothetical protein ELR57_21950 [Cohnella sp. AR92]